MDKTINHKKPYNLTLSLKHMINIQEKKNKIISFLKIAGPSLPVRIAKTIEMEPIFTSAILSELLDAKQIKTSFMKIDASPLYLLSGQEQKLEDHTENLKPIEKEALLKLKENKTLSDENEEPSIRVALRNIKDFAIPHKNQDKITWEYAFPTEEETQPQKPANHQPLINPKPIEPIFKTPPSAKHTINEADYQRSRLSAKRTNPKPFLKKIEEFLDKQNTEIISIEEVDKRKVIAKIKSEIQTSLLFAFNKKRITENELMKCYKQAKILALPYHIITSGEPTKKMTETIDAYKKLIRIDQLKT